MFNSYSCQLDVRLEQFSPESKRNKSNNWFGIDVELTQMLLDEAQCSYNVLEVSWGRALIMLTDGELDLILNVSKTRKREEDFYFIGPIRHETVVFATYQHFNYNLKTITDIVNLDKPIAIQRNAYYGKVIQQLLEQEDYQESFVHVANNETKLRLLKRGRISGFLEAKRNIIHGIKNDNSYEGVWFPDVVINQTPVYFALSKKSINEELKQKISESFKRLVRQGKISEIVLEHQNIESPTIATQDN
jgi:polar amino acid transport system substrate-binding protein